MRIADSSQVKLKVKLTVNSNTALVHELLVLIIHHKNFFPTSPGGKNKMHKNIKREISQHQNFSIYGILISILQVHVCVYTYSLTSII